MGMGLTSVYSQTSSCVYNVTLYQGLANCQASSVDWSMYADWGSCNGSTDVANIDFDGYIGGAMPCLPSDVRLKQGIETLTDSLEKIMKIDTVEYDWNNKLNDYEYLEKVGKLHTIGLIAQEVKQYFPEVINVNPNGYYSIDYTKLNAVLVEAIKEQQVFIEDIDKELEFIEIKLR